MSHEMLRAVFAGALHFIIRPVSSTLKWAKPFPGMVLMPGGVLVSEGEAAVTPNGVPWVIAEQFDRLLYEEEASGRVVSAESALLFARECAAHFYGVHALRPPPAQDGYRIPGDLISTSRN